MRRVVLDASSSTATYYGPASVRIAALMRFVMRPVPNTIASTGFAVLTAIKVPFTFLYAATTTDDFVGYLINNTSGAAYPAVTAATFEAELVVPQQSLLGRFADATIPIANQIATLQTQTVNLRHTRDLLLPRLISGEVPLCDRYGDAEVMSV